MVDTVTIATDGGAAVRRAVEGLPGVWAAVDPVTGAVRLTAKLDGLHVRLRADGEVRVTGSLCKYAGGDNIQNLTLAGVERAVEDLARALHLDAGEARVYRLDVGATLRMPRPPGVYLDRLISCPRTQRAEYEGETVMFLAGKARKARQARRCLSFYDKGKQAGVESENLLRFEVQFRRRVKEQLGQALTLVDLYERATFGRLVRRWQQEFQGLHLARRHDLQPTGKIRDLERQLARLGLQAAGGGAAVNRALSVWRAEGHLTDRQFFRLKKRVNELASGGAVEEDQQVIYELNRAVRQAADRTRSTQAHTFEVNLN